jgi:LCP family protein required for cell wall assembly
MSDYPDNWFREEPGQGGAGRRPGAGEPTVKLPAGSGQPAPGGRPGGSADPGYGSPASPGYGSPAGAGPAWPSQPPPRSAADRPAGPYGPGSPGPGSPGPGGPGPGSPGPGGPGRGRTGRRRLRPRRIFGITGLVVVLLLVAITGFYFYLNSQLVKRNVLVDYAGRPVAGAGTNWLITGSDSRQGLSGKEEQKLATGHDIGGRRSDTMLILHIPSNGGRPVLVSLPRDSYLPIPGFGTNKLNAAYSFGGPKLLAKTIQNATGLRIDHYMGIGFGGFVHVVDAIGGVRLCLPGPMTDPKAGLHLKAGCQVLDGDQALGYVRTRNFSISDLQREQDQRLFIKALLHKMTSVGTLVNPFKALPAASGAVGSLTVDNGTSLYQLVKVAFALKGPQTTTVPIANADLQTADGDAVQWNSAEAQELFHDLNTDQKIPRDLLTGSKAAPTV